MNPITKVLKASIDYERRKRQVLKINRNILTNKWKMKKAKCTKITKMDKKDTYGNTSFVIEFENGDKGFYTSKIEDQKKFVVGNVADYQIEEKQGAKGVYYKITLPQSEAVFIKGGKSPVDPRAQFIGFSAAYAKDLVVAGKVDIGNMNAFSEAIFKNMMKLYDTIKN